ncbi:type IV pilin-like G/H family protein [Anabaena sphaerica FACHB-251]|uniref:Type IV pilin-like G/H family protein n=1 Tax=Anabaena sphaerica FACHB-251 TaxID=2692883 RepID=A0A926WJI3_9NOST|nr:type IV pilin-like G/H family protein [Anabaena sphaerica]MBD2295330.1 type IV pilin-like G/H family protein [Anabaena sphaerica FACHB-251]
MKSELKAKFLQHLLGKKKDNQGFTLIELLVVIIIIGILSAIALPSFLNQAKKAKQSEAKTYVGSLNRGDQAYYAENDTFAGADTNVNTSVTAAMNALGIGIATQTQNYNYGTSAYLNGGGSNVYSTSYSSLNSASSGLKNYNGKVYLQQVGANSELTSLAFMCEAQKVNVSLANMGTGTTCPTDWKLIK